MPLGSLDRFPVIPINGKYSTVSMKHIAPDSLIEDAKTCQIEINDDTNKT